MSNQLPDEEDPLEIHYTSEQRIPPDVPPQLPGIWELPNARGPYLVIHTIRKSTRIHNGYDVIGTWLIYPQDRPVLIHKWVCFDIMRELLPAELGSWRERTEYYYGKFLEEVASGRIDLSSKLVIILVGGLSGYTR